MVFVRRALPTISAFAFILAGCGAASSPAVPAGSSTRTGSAGASNAASASVAAAGKPASSSASSGGLQAMVDGARKEGALNLVWGEGTEGGSKGIEQIAAGFNKAYGLDLKVQFTPGPSMPDMGAKMIQEVQTNRPATSDLY